MVSSGRDSFFILHNALASSIRCGSFFNPRNHFLCVSGSAGSCQDVPPIVGHVKLPFVRDSVLRSFAVYELQCTACPKKYIGQTGGPIKSRLREHCASASSAFHQHTFNQHNSPPETCVEWRILAMQRNMMKRRALEAIFISQQRSSLVNGCSGDALFTFVT